MKKRPLLIPLCLSALIAACDVSDNDDGDNTIGAGGTGGSQTGDPVVVDFPIAFVERPVPIGFADDNAIQMTVLENDLLDPTEFRPGARLVIKDRASVSAASRVITEGVFPPIIEEVAEGETPAEPQEPLYDVRDLSVNADGDKLVFSMRAPEIEGADEEDQPTWNIWEYDLATDTLSRVIESDLIAEAGHDRSPAFLPDDSIVFSSTRQRQSKSLLLDQSRPQYAYVTERDQDARAFTLHTIDEDRVEIKQISFGKGHDLQPTVLDDGRILFLRGDSNQNRLSLYTMNPYGGNLELHYGYHSPSSQTGGEQPQGALANPKQMPNGQIMINFRPRETQLLGGDIYSVDTFNYIDVSRPTVANNGATGPAERSLSFGQVLLDGQSPHGYFNSASPLFDGTGRLLVSWMPCLIKGYDFDIFVRTVVPTELTEPAAETLYQLINIDGELIDRDGNVLAEGDAAVEVTSDEVITLPCTLETLASDAIELSDPQFGIWVYDPETETQDPVVFANEPGIMYTDVVVFQARANPDFILPAGDNALEQELIEENVGMLHIRSIYDFDGFDLSPNGIAAMADPLQTPPDSRPVRFVRFYEEANLPHEDDYEIDLGLVRGRNNSPAKSIIGYAQVHPDGSVKTKLPADVAFSMEFLDANGRRVNGPLGAGHRNWLSVAAGEERECYGCHSADSTYPHGRIDAQGEPAYLGALAPAPFTNTMLLDPEGTPYSDVPEVGETMAEFYVRIKRADLAVEEDPLQPSLDIVFQDEWTDPSSGATPGRDISMVYGSPDAGTIGPENLSTQAPVMISDCLTEWNPLCRIVIDYPDHIQPIFEVERSMTVAGMDIVGTCIDCHSTTDPDGMAQIPAPDMNNLQLDFTPIISPLDDDMVFLKGYDELFANGDPLLEIDPETGNLRVQLIPLVIDGEIQYETVQSRDPVTDALLFEATNALGEIVCVPLNSTDPNITYNLDANGANIPCLEFVLAPDEDGNLMRVPILVPNEQGRYLSGNGANAAQNQRFFAVFAPGGAHDGYLNDAELKLFSEWLDAGGQYYNEIFKALED